MLYCYSGKSVDAHFRNLTQAVMAAFGQGSLVRKKSRACETTAPQAFSVGSRFEDEQLARGKLSKARQILSLFRNILIGPPAPAFSIFRVLIPFVLISNLYAQYRLDTWTTDNGLPQNSITGLTQTPDEYIWLTTNDGLVRFDGNRFKVFNRSNTPQITTNRLSAAFADKTGRMWFRAEDGGILYYEKGVFSIAAKPGELPPDQRSPFFDDTTSWRFLGRIF